LAREGRYVPAVLEVGEDHVVVADLAPQEAQPAGVATARLREGGTQGARPRCGGEEEGGGQGEQVASIGRQVPWRDALFEGSHCVGERYLAQQDGMGQEPAVAPASEEATVDDGGSQ